MAIAVVIATAVLVGLVIVVLARQGSVGRLSEEDGTKDPQSDVVERPAGPGAEAMDTDAPGQPVIPPPDPNERSW
jgi:hypothetical protein